MTETPTAAHVKDEEGFIDLDEMERDWFFLQEMRLQQQKLEVAIGKCEAAFKAKMDAAGANGFKIGGVKKVSYKQDATFPVARFTAANPITAAVYMKEVKAFDLEAFKRERPVEYQQWRSRSFKFIQPKKVN